MITCIRVNEFAFLPDDNPHPPIGLISGLMLHCASYPGWEKIRYTIVLKCANFADFLPFSA